MGKKDLGEIRYRYKKFLMPHESQFLKVTPIKKNAKKKGNKKHYTILAIAGGGLLLLLLLIITIVCCVKKRNNEPNINDVDDRLIDN